MHTIPMPPCFITPHTQHRRGDGIGQVQMNANTMEEAGEQLRGFDESRLCDLLAQARPWEQSMGVFSSPVSGQ